MEWKRRVVQLWKAGQKGRGVERGQTYYVVGGGRGIGSVRPVLGGPVLELNTL